MKKLILLSVVALVAMTSCNCKSKVAMKSESDSLSNAIGTLMGMQLKSTIKDGQYNADIIAAAIDKVMTTKDEAELDSIVTNADEYFRNYIMVVVPAQKAEASSKFLGETEKKSGVKKTESGLLYEIVGAGDMTMMPTNATDTVTVNYKGTLANGEEFDSSYQRGEPAIFPLDGVITGWTEGIKLIGKGGKIKLYIPSNLAYGDQGPLGGEALVFDVELLDVKTAQ